MKRRNFLSTIGIGTVAISTVPTIAKNTNKQKPNILFIFADDETYKSIHCLNNKEVETPNLDRLVKNGVTFTHAYNMGSWSGAVCIASRAMLNTGKFLWQARKKEKQHPQMAKEGSFWSQRLSKLGYETYMTGKWHVGHIHPSKIFDHSVHVRPGMPKQTKAGYNRPQEGKEDIWKPWDKKFGGFWKGGKHWSEVLKDDAINFLNQAKKSDKPFFMYLAFNAAHDPRQSPKEFVDKYPLDKIKVPKSYIPTYPYQNSIGCGKSLRDERLAPFPRTKFAIKTNRQEYYAIITHMDLQIGKILDTLEKTGQAKNTYIFFTADHGLACGNHGLMGKQNMYDHSVRVPLFVNGPNIPKNKQFDTPVYLQDIMATTLDIAGDKNPKGISFRSLLPIINEERKENYAAIYGAYRNSQRMITVDHFKLIYYPKIDKYLMFDLKKDPNEIVNLADKSKFRKKRIYLIKELHKLEKQLKGPLFRT